MARGESQTLLIWTIIFLIFSLIMIIVSVVMRSKWTEAASQLTDVTSKNNQLTSENSTLKNEGAKLRELIGAVADKSVADMETDHASHVAEYSPTLTPLDPSSSYLTLLSNLKSSYENKVDENKTLSDNYFKSQVELARNNESKRQLQTVFEGEVAKIRGELDMEKTRYKSLEDKWNESNQGLLAKIDTIDANAREAIAEANKQRDTANRRSDQVLLINTKLTTTLAELDSPIPTYTDATIFWVNSDSTKVRINLGSNHGLRTRMPFSVYPADVKEISVNSGKAKIEITDIIDGNTAEARVMDDILMNPIIPGDIIYTPVWQPGQNIHVALSTGLDLDGDGIPDPHKVMMLIKQCGGDVDAYIDDLTGEMISENDRIVRETFLVGEIGRETRYLVIGDTPDPDSSVTLFNARRELENSAKDYGLTTITLKDMLALMGYRPQSQTVGFGPRNRATNNYEMHPDVVNQRMPGSVFKKYENPDAEPDTNNKVPVSPLFNQRKVARPTGTVSPLFQPKSASTKNAESN